MTSAARRQKQWLVAYGPELRCSRGKKTHYGPELRCLTPKKMLRNLQCQPGFEPAPFWLIKGYSSIVTIEEGHMLESFFSKYMKAREVDLFFVWSGAVSDYKV